MYKECCYTNESILKIIIFEKLTPLRFSEKFPDMIMGCFRSIIHGWQLVMVQVEAIMIFQPGVST